MKPEHSADIRRSLSRRCARLGIPVNGIFELTPRCNLKCRMCYVRMTPDQMKSVGRERTAEEWLNIAKDATDAGMMFLLITGGEPTIRKDFPQIYEGLSKMGLSISINTNGTLLTDEIFDLWHRLPPAQINITLYGTCREDYDKLCGDPDAFDRVTKAIERLRSENILVHLNSTITPANISDTESIRKYALSHGLDLRMTAYCFPPVRRSGCGADIEFSRISPETAGELTVQNLYCQQGKDALMRCAENMSAVESSEWDAHCGEPISCMAGRSQFWMTWYGGMTPCGMLNEPVTYPFDDGFQPAWSLLKNETAKITLCPDCVKCGEKATCMNCAAVTYTETGRFDGKPEYVCKMNRAYRESLIKYSKMLE